VHCACTIEERYKTWMIARGEWRARFPSRATVGFHLNTIYSPLCAWDDIVMAFQRAARSDEKLKTFVNTFLGLPYRGKGEAISAHFLSSRAESYPTAGSGEDALEVIPSAVGLLTASVDVQGDRIELFIWGWGAGSERWLIAWEQIQGDPGKADVWLELERRRRQQRQHESGATLTIAAMCVDAGYQTDMVHAYCNKHSVDDRVIAIVGRSGAGKKLLTPPDKQKFKRTGSRRPTHVVGTDSGKSLLASALRVKEPGPNYVHFPASTDPVFYEQITSERLVTRYTHGRPQKVWELIVGRRNEALDGAVYAEAALLLLGVNIRKQLPEIVKHVQAIGAAAAGARIPTTAAPAPRRVFSKGLDR
jgi:phage terminase large subunit GpA-like protein